MVQGGGTQRSGSHLQSAASTYWSSKLMFWIFNHLLVSGSAIRTERLPHRMMDIASCILR
jgi:hypothetical protein